MGPSERHVSIFLVFILTTFWWNGSGAMTGGGNSGGSNGGSGDIETCYLIESSPRKSASPISHHHSDNNGLLMDINLDGMRGLSSLGSSKVSSIPIKSDIGDEDQILCHLRTLQPDMNFDNLTSHLPLPIEKINILRLVCNDVLFFESLLGPEQLSGFSELSELTIEKCKIKFIPTESFRGLFHLKKLKLNTGNSDWAARSLEISSGAFENLPSLQRLDLGFNQLWSLPERLLCQLPHLQTLNLTHNLLSDIDDLGVPGLKGLAVGSIRNSESRELTIGGTPCLSDLRSLDLSHNTLRRLGSSRLDRLKRLEDLRLDHNWLEEVDDEAFSDLGNLKSLNLSSNRLIALPASLFQHSKGLRSLDLKNNSLAALSPGLLSGLEWLVTLDLSRNSLTSQWITIEAFRGLVRLVILNLSNNQLTHLTPATFADLYTLQVLDLEGNLISSIADSTFMPMSNLHHLNLGRNKLLSITSKMFNGLYVLHKLNLDYNQLNRIEVGSLRNCTSLSDLGLVGNQLDHVPEALRGLQYLKTLDLGENRITFLSNDSFFGMSQLYGLRLVDNQLEEIPRGVCDPITDLRVFNVAQNKINRISASAFSSCPELRVLRLDSNSLDNLPSSLGPQLPKLLWLNVSENKIQRADYDLLPSSLEWFDVSHNQLESLSGAWTNPTSNTLSKSGHSPTSFSILAHDHYYGHHNGRLRVVDASHNLLTELDSNGVPPGLDRLILTYNRLVKIWPETFSRSIHLRRVDLIGNQLENVPLSALRFQQIGSGKPLPEFFLGGNPFLCDCEMEWLLRVTQLSSTRQYPLVMDLDSIVCRLTYSRSVSHVPLPEIKSQNFLCPYTFHCFQTCQCCEFDACDCSMTCPSNCTCYHGDSWTANVVDCARSNLSEIPNQIPMDSTEAFLDGNSIRILKSHSFIGRKTLRLLYLNSSRIETISNKSFNGLQSLEILHLEGNRLTQLVGYEFDHLNKLRELYLQDNLIHSISNSTFLSLKELEILRLDGNQLSVFTVWQLSLNPYLVEIGLGRNAWNCDCVFLHQLYGWVTDNSKKVIDLGNIQCVWNSTHEPGPHLLDYNSTCGTSWALIQGGLERLSFRSLLPILIGLVSGLLVILTLIIFIFTCRETVRLWFYSRFGIRLCSEREVLEDSEKVFDAYFIYSQKDEEFVTRKIGDELETSDNYRLCLHYRDLISETGDLKEMMSGALESSRTLVIFLSRNFFQIEWTTLDFRTGIQTILKASTKKVPRKAEVVIVIMEDVPAEDQLMNPDFRTWIRNFGTQTSKILKWSDKQFWSKFKFSLPEPTSHYHSNITSHTTSSSASLSVRAPSGKYYPASESEPPPVPTTVGSAPPLTSKFWYGPTSGIMANFVALPPKYSAGQFGGGTPGRLTTLSRADSSPPDPTTIEDPDDIPSFLFQPNAKSPVPMANFGRNALRSTSSTATGESYLSLEGEHVYSTLDPPSPISKIQLPNGFTYSPAPQVSPWHVGHHVKSSGNYVSPKTKARRKSSSSSGNHKGDGVLNSTNNPTTTVQTYLV